jgi:hypothetical protein
MAEFRGIKCDLCGNIVAEEAATKKLIRFKGPKVNGEYTEDLCADCTVVPPGVELKPWPRMKSGESDEREVAPEG